MQAIRPLSSSSSSLSSSPYGYVQFETSAKIAEDFSSKLFIGDEPPTTGALCVEGVASEDKAEECEIEAGNEEENEDDDDGEDEDQDEEFSFACANPDGSLICADDVFQNGEIRPVFPIFNRDLLFAGGDDGHGAGGRGASSAWPSLRKIFVEEANDLRPSSSASESDELEGVPEGTYCEWSGKAAAMSSCKKSNSTGFSRLWRFRDLVHRSSSDGKDAFVFLNPNHHHQPHPHHNSTRPTAAAKPSNEAIRKTDKAEEEKRKKSSSYGKPAAAAKGKAKGRQTASSAHEKHYVRNRAKQEGDRRRSYLPYRQDLVGFFTNVNGLSRNVHPF